MSVVSMTGYGAASQSWDPPEGGRGALRVDVEARSVNARFLEVKMRQPFGADAERKVRAVADARLGRGRVEIAVFIRRDPAADDGEQDAMASLGLDAAQVSNAAAAIVKTAALAHEAGLELQQPTALDLIRYLSSAKPRAQDGPTAVPPFLEALVASAVDALVAFRKTEGSHLETVLRELAGQLEQAAATLNADLPAEGERLHQRITTRLADLTARAGVAALEPERVAQEVAIVVARGDVEEELARIESHLAQMRSTLDAEPTAGQGKTLDFLTQELLREFTTMGSKVTSHEASRVVIDAKAIIERIREQVQNVE